LLQRIGGSLDFERSCGRSPFLTGLYVSRHRSDANQGTTAAVAFATIA
jgi:hypothetical protein